VYGITVPAGAATQRSFEPGLGTSAWVADPLDPALTVPDSSNTMYYHADHLGTTRFMTDSTGADIDHATYTAFGQRLSGDANRYGYAGAWGYQSTLDESTAPPSDLFPFLHVCHRYYDPATGRFLQRDPIGILGGLNVYAYVGATATLRVDPTGLQSPARILDCQDACEVWRNAGGVVCGGGTTAYANCITSCNKGYWPPPPAPQPPPKDFKPWPGCCPPEDTGVPSPGTGRPSKPVKPPSNLPVNPPSCGGGGGSAAVGFLLPLVLLTLLRFSGTRVKAGLIGQGRKGPNRVPRSEHRTTRGAGRSNE
jgi:RHS repeat-associated protein